MGQSTVKSPATDESRLMYQFGPFQVNVAERKLLRNGNSVSLTPKAFEVLLILVENHGRVVEKDELINRVWVDSFVEEGNLKVTVSMLRKALEDGADQHRYIETIPRRGYRFIADVKDFSTSSETVVVQEHARSVITIEESVQRPVTGRIATLAQSFVATHQKTALFTLILLALALVVVAVAIFRIVTHDRKAPANQMKITRLTTSGAAEGAAISPDGKYVTYGVKETDGREALVLEQLATGSKLQIVPPDDVNYIGSTFSPDGNLIYYVALRHGSDETGNLGALYRVPVIGGAPQKVLTHVSRPVTISPDGSRIAFARLIQAGVTVDLVVANADGTDEHTLASSTKPNCFTDDGPSWSPDGKTIACGTFGRFGPMTPNAASEGYATVMSIDAQSGAVKEMTSERWYILGRVSWFADGSGLIITAIGHAGERYQIWQLSYPSGEVKRITNDVSDYQSVSLSVANDSKTIASVLNDFVSSVWITPVDSATERPRQITADTSSLDGSHGLVWTPDGGFIWSSMAGGNWNIWSMKADGSNRKQLTTEVDGDRFPVVSPDGRYVVFESRRGGGVPAIWRMDIDGGNLKQLTKVPSFNPRCTPDSSWVVYQAEKSPVGKIWKVPIDGGEPIQLTDYIAQHPDISPDGKSIACTYLDQEPQPHWRMGIIPFTGGRPVKTLDLPASAIGTSYLQVFHWTPDGNAIDYVSTEGGSANIWSQPLSGGKPIRLTDFKAPYIFGFDISRDGKQIACALGRLPTDVVLISNFR